MCCFVKGIEPVLVINKDDITDKSFIENVKSSYNKVLEIIVTSAKTDKIIELANQIEGICAFAGQSAVGKSSLINALTGESNAEIGELSKKIERGKQTTRVVSLYKIGNGYLADTAGFSSLEVQMLVELSAQEVSRYYPDFLEFLTECKYRSCLHKQKGDCGIIKRVESDDISKMRYQNYLKIIEGLQVKKF